VSPARPGLPPSSQAQRISAIRVVSPFGTETVGPKISLTIFVGECIRIGLSYFL
jgi:hypothetical protein